MLILTGTVLKIKEAEKKDYVRILNEDSIIEVTTDKNKYTKGEVVEMKIEVGVYQGRTYFTEMNE